MTDRSPTSDSTASDDRASSDDRAASDDWAVLSDMDGTLLDTERSWLLVLEQFVREHTGSADAALVAALEGADLAQAAALLVERLALPLAPAEIVAELDRRCLIAYTETVTWRPGAADLVQALVVAGVPLALVTSSPRHWVERFGQTLDLSAFRVIITADDTPRTKPAPDPYLRAAAALGMPAGRCVALEDSFVGASAAVAAGCTTLVVDGGGRVLPSGARRIGSLVDVDVRMLRLAAQGVQSS